MAFSDADSVAMAVKVRQHDEKLPVVCAQVERHETRITVLESTLDIKFNKIMSELKEIKEQGR